MPSWSSSFSSAHGPPPSAVLNADLELEEKHMKSCFEHLHNVFIYKVIYIRFYEVFTYIKKNYFAGRRGQFPIALQMNGV